MQLGSKIIELQGNEKLQAVLNNAKILPEKRGFCVCMVFMPSDGGILPEAAPRLRFAKEYYEDDVIDDVFHANMIAALKFLTFEVRCQRRRSCYEKRHQEKRQETSQMY
jgi:hypothetical protein